jgi:hypothetical protein
LLGLWGAGGYSGLHCVTRPDSSAKFIGTLLLLRRQSVQPDKIDPDVRRGFNGVINDALAVNALRDIDSRRGNLNLFTRDLVCLTLRMGRSGGQCDRKESDYHARHF